MIDGHGYPRIQAAFLGKALKSEPPPPPNYLVLLYQYLPGGEKKTTVPVLVLEPALIS